MREIEYTAERLAWRFRDDTYVIFRVMKKSRGKMQDVVADDKTLEWWTREFIADLSQKYGNQNRYGVTTNSTAAMRIMRALWDRIDKHKAAVIERDNAALQREKETFVPVFEE